jgi:hypothetical protein
MVQIYSALDTRAIKPEEKAMRATTKGIII